MLGHLQVDTSLYHNELFDCYRCFDPKLGETVFVKILNTGRGSLSTSTTDFVRECQILKELNHPYIARYINHYSIEGRLALVTEYYDGISLRQLLQEENPSIDESYNILEQIAAALSYLQQRGVIHNDLKPENILVLPIGSIRIVDFGIAQNISSPIDSKVQQLAGTLLYMSPEQHDPTSKLSTSSDLYSFAIIAYELLTGRLCHGALKLASLPPPLQKIFAKALQREPEKRYQHPLNFIDALKAHKSTLSSKVSAQVRPIMLTRGLVSPAQVVKNPLKPLSHPESYFTQLCALPPHFWPLATLWMPNRQIPQGDLVRPTPFETRHVSEGASSDACHLSHSTQPLSEEPSMYPCADQVTASDRLITGLFVEAATTDVRSYLMLHQLKGMLLRGGSDTPEALSALLNRVALGESFAEDISVEAGSPTHRATTHSQLAATFFSDFSFKTNKLKLSALHGTFYATALPLMGKESILPLNFTTVTPSTPVTFDLPVGWGVWIFSSHTPMDLVAKELIGSILASMSYLHLEAVCTRLCRLLSERASLRTHLPLFQRVHRIPQKVGVCAMIHSPLPCRGNPPYSEWT